MKNVSVVSLVILKIVLFCRNGIELIEEDEELIDGDYEVVNTGPEAIGDDEYFVKDEGEIYYVGDDDDRVNDIIDDDDNQGHHEDDTGMTQLLVLLFIYS